MARCSTYLNFDGNTEEAFAFYEKVFQTRLSHPAMRMGDAPNGPGMPELSEAEKRLIMHIELPITGGHVLMGTDILRSMGHSLTVGNNVHINVEPDTREEATRLFLALGEGGTVSMPLADMFWGGYFGALTDRFGISWMINCANE